MTLPRIEEPRKPRADDDAVVIVDIDGVLANMSAFEGILHNRELSKPERWEAFFAHSEEATVLDSGFDLVCALDSLGYTVVYSTSRPHFSRAGTRRWLSTHDFPPGRALLTRDPLDLGRHRRHAWQVKHSHAQAVYRQHGKWLRKFVDDDDAAVDMLTSLSIPAISPTLLTGLSTIALRNVIENS